MPKYTLLEIVQDILSDSNGEEVSSLSETLEATQAANIVRTTFYDIITGREIPEHRQFFKLTALADTTRPTHFEYPDRTLDVQTIWYDASDDLSFEYKEVEYCEPLEFIQRADSLQSNFVQVEDKEAGVKLRVGSDDPPEFWTSFDDRYIVMNSYKSTVDDTLQTSKSRAYGTIEPTFELTETFVPDIDENYFPLLVSESKSMFLSLYQGGNPKVEQRARRNRARIQDNKSKKRQDKRYSDFGR